MSKIITIFRKFICLSVIILIVTCVNVNSALAHRPHDVIEQIELSPDYGKDRTLFIVVRNNLFKSTNGGESWRRINRGLDTKFFTPLSSLAISQLNPQVLFLSSQENGAYKSEDGGESWRKINNGLDKLFTGILEISDSDDKLALMTMADKRLGEEKQLYKTDDGGEKWRLVFDNTASITAIAFSPSNDSNIIIGDRQGKLHFSENRGDTWKTGTTIKNSGAITSIAFSPNVASDNTFFVGTETGGILKTVDGGSSFAKIDRGISDLNIRDIAIQPGNNGAYSIWVSTYNEGVFVSQDGGNNWEKSSNGLTKDHQADSLSLPHFTEIKFPSNFLQDKTMFVAGFNGLFKSNDSGKTWQQIETLSGDTVTALAISPNYQNDATVAITKYIRNIFISQDGGKTWRKSNKGLEVPRLFKSFAKPDQDPRRFFHIAFSPNYTSDKQIFATILWNNFLKSDNSGDSWKIIALDNPKGEALRGMTIVPSPNYAADKIIYLGTQYGAIFRSTDGGENFKHLSKLKRHSTNEPLSLIISPDYATDRTLYASGLQGVYKTVDGGVTWQVMTEGTPLAGKYNDHIRLAISPNYAVDSTVLAGTDDGFYITRNSGESWEELQSPAYGENVYIEDVAISPNYASDRTFLASTRGRGLFKTTDGGKNFRKIGNNSLEFSRLSDLPSAGIPIQFSPAYAKDRTIYAFGAAGTQVFKSTDGGNNWQVLDISAPEDGDYDILTKLDLFFFIYRPIVLRLAIALALAILGFFTLGFLRLEKFLPFNKLAIKVIGTAVIFAIVSIALLK
jgi:photosystem II stability/assembly factor-like uncharacterized protein